MQPSPWPSRRAPLSGPRHRGARRCGPCWPQALGHVHPSGPCSDPWTAGNPQRHPVRVAGQVVAAAPLTPNVPLSLQPWLGGKKAPQSRRSSGRLCSAGARRHGAAAHPGRSRRHRAQCDQDQAAAVLLGGRRRPRAARAVRGGGPTVWLRLLVQHTGGLCRLASRSAAPTCATTSSARLRRHPSCGCAQVLETELGSDEKH